MYFEINFFTPACFFIYYYRKMYFEMNFFKPARFLYQFLLQTVYIWTQCPLYYFRYFRDISGTLSWQGHWQTSDITSITWKKYIINYYQLDILPLLQCDSAILCLKNNVATQPPPPPNIRTCYIFSRDLRTRFSFYPAAWDHQ